jgi:predicted permease
MSGYRPPRWLERLLEWALPPGLSGQSALGDLAEGFERRALVSPMRARLWYAGQTASIVTYRVFTGSGVESSGSDSYLFMDLKWSLRSVFRHPGFAIGVVTVLGLGIGANTAVYSVVDGTVRNTSWWSEPDQTVAIWPERTVSFGEIELYKPEQTAYRTLGGYVESAFALNTRDGESLSVNGVYITPALFQELAVQPRLGRPLVPDDAYLGVEAVAVISDALWQQSFGGDPSVVGSRIEVSGYPVTVVGVQGPGGVAPGGQTEIWLPLIMDPRDDDYYKAQSHTLVGVLRSGADFDDAAADLTAHTERLSDMFPSFYPRGWADGEANVARADAAQRRLVQTPLLLLMAGTGLLLLVTALNVGNLLLGRSIERRKELAVRASLGAGRGRIVRQLLVEGSVLTIAALVVGLVSGAFGGEWVAGLFVGEVVVRSSSVFSSSVVGFVLGISAVACLVLNGVPIAHYLRSQRRGLVVRPNAGSGVQRSLVTVQAALATLLLVTATLLIATVGNLRDVPLGFEPDGIVTVALSAPEDRVSDRAMARQLYDRLISNAEAIPGVQAAGLTERLPLRRQAADAPINPEWEPVQVRAASIKAPKHRVDPGFFEAMGVEPIEGRLLTFEDQADTAMAVVINESLAAMLWPNGGGGVNQRIAIDPHAWDLFIPIVGIVPDIRSGEMAGPVGPAMYVALAESPSRDVTMVVRTAEAAPDVLAALRSAVRQSDPLVPVRSISRMEDVVRAAYATSWVMMGLLIVLAVLATALGAIGIYAVLAQHVTANRREIGVRMALGAEPGKVVRSVVRSGLLLAGIGILIGSAGAAMATRFVEAMLFEVSALEPMAYVAPALALCVAAALAALVPAARAGSLPPAEVLRSE